MKKSFLCFLFGGLVLFHTNLLAQNTYDSSFKKVYKVAVFAPLYLDSIFSGIKLKTENSLPKFAMPAVDFVQGAEIAFDSLSAAGEHVEAFIYDTKSATRPLLQLLHGIQSDSID